MEIDREPIRRLVFRTLWTHTRLYLWLPLADKVSQKVRDLSLDRFGWLSSPEVEAQINQQEQYGPI